MCKHNLCNLSSEHRGLPTINLRGNVVIIPHMEARFRFYSRQSHVITEEDDWRITRDKIAYICKEIE